MSTNNTINVDHVVGHKGAGFLFPENTLIAFKKAASLGLKRTEFDVRLTKDNVAVLSNKDSLLKCALKDVLISQSNYSDLISADVSSYHVAYKGSLCHLPLLIDALGVIRDENLHPQIELKVNNDNDADLSKAVADILDQFYDLHSGPLPLITSFSPKAISQFKKYAQKEYETGLLIHSESTDDWAKEAIKCNPDCIHIFSGHINYGLNAYKVTSVKNAKSILALGVRRFTTDVPELFLPQP
jgi:glycerophosphoryl diester phosphodiesterase